MKPDFAKNQKTLAALALPGMLLARSALPQTEPPAMAPLASANAPPIRLPKVVVTAAWLDAAPLGAQRADTSPRARIVAPDTAALLEGVPGAAVVRNGPQTGIVQLRGLSGDRVKVAVDGMTLTPACPNHMDPPLHYAAPTSLDTLTVMAGITPVSLGGDSPGGTVLALPPPPRFATNEQALGFGELGGFYRSSNDGYGFNGAGGVADEGLSAAYQGSWQRGNDLRFPGGRVSDTGYDTQQHSLLTGWRAGHGVWSLDAGLLRTRDAGTPALPMDMLKDDGYRVGLKHQGHYNFGSVEGRFYFHTIDHLMDNYSLRPVAANSMPMFSPASSEDAGVNLGLAVPKEVHIFRVGTGFHLNLFDAYQQNAVTDAQQDTLHDASRARVGTYAEWQADWSERWSTLLGARNDSVMSDAAAVERFYAPGRADAARFNASDRDFLDANFDATVSVRFRPNAGSAYELGVARKSRAPSLLERYLWTPLSASAGQADGRTYLGSLDLDPEISHQVAFTAEWRGPKWRLQVTPFYNLVSDYVQGTPIARRDSNGRPVLQFQNLDGAELYGVDGLARYDFDEHFAWRGAVSYVRGRNRDTDDDLYRIAPLRGTLGLDHRWRGWESTVEVVLVDDQNKVAAYNAEPRTPGYALLHLRTGFAFRSHVRVQLGLENVTNERYADHLGGINRVLDSDVAVGQRIPGAGRFVYAAVSYRF